MLLRSFVLSVLALTLSACNLSGTGEKGPFKINSKVSLSKLNNQANPIASETLNTIVTSRNGAYSFSDINWNGWSQLEITGKYFNEFTVSSSTDSLSLRAITKKDRTFDRANVHLFSHLAAARIKQHVTNGENRLRAWGKTQQEMKQIFGLKRVSQNIHRGVEKLSLLRGSGRYRKDNANLLLFTGSFLAVGGDSASLELLTTDFANDGQFNAEGVALFNSIASMGATDGLLETLSSNLRSYGISNPPNNGDMKQLPVWVNQNALDNTAPVVTVTGENPVTIVVGTPYVDEGASATDNIDGVVTAVAIDASDVIDTSAVATHTVTYNAVDIAGNIGVARRNVNVVLGPDTEAPVITLTNGTTQSLEVYTGATTPAYQDPGFTVTDNRDTSVQVTVSGTVDMAVIGRYLIDYSATDVAGNTTTETRTVDVIDTMNPVVTLIGLPSIDVYLDVDYQDQGATAVDAYEGTLAIVPTGSVDIHTLGTNELVFTAEDSSGNSAFVTRLVTVIEAPDLIAPVLTLVGNPLIIVEAGSSYTDQGAMADDNKDGNITADITVSGSVNINIPATYTLTYAVKDAANNSADSIDRTVIVKDSIAPVLTLNGSSSLVIQKSTDYSDQGATAIDSFEGNISSNIVVNNPLLTNTPATYIITYNVADSSGNTAQQITRVVRVNAPPLANAGTDVSVVTGSTVDLLGSASDTDGTGAVSYQWKRGNTVLSSTASYSYTPQNSETLTFEVTDSDGAITTDTVDVVVTLPAAYQIVFVVDTTTVPRNLDVALFTQGLQLTTSVIDGSGNTVVGASPTFDVTPVDLSTPGSYSVDFSYTDPYDRTILKTLIIIVENHAPIASLVNVTVDEDTINNPITLEGTDADVGDTLTYTTTAPSNGVLSGSGKNITYTPAANFFGTDSFTFTVSDGIASSTATVSITVTDVAEPNNAPVAVAQSVTFDEDTTENAITLEGTDADAGDTLTYTTTAPSNGVLSGSGKNITYTPTANFFGTDSFIFTVSDGTDSATATVSITVTDVPEPNQVPVANARSATVDENTTDNLIVLSGADPDGSNSALIYAISTQPTFGTLSGTAPNVTYTPNSNYSGVDEFYFTVSDGVDLSAAAKVLITVKALEREQNFAIALGDVISDGQPSIGAGKLELPGSIDIYTFSAIAGQEVVFDIQNNGGFNLGFNTYYVVKDASGAEVVNSQLAHDASAVLTLGGEYTLTVDSNIDNVGTYQFQIIGARSLEFTDNPLHVALGTTPDSFGELLINNTRVNAEFTDPYIPMLTYDSSSIDLATAGSYILSVQHSDSANRVISKDITIVVDEGGVVSDYQIVFSQNPLYIALGSHEDDVYYDISNATTVVDQFGDVLYNSGYLEPAEYLTAAQLSVAGTHNIHFSFYDDFERLVEAALQVIVTADPLLVNKPPRISTLFTVNARVGIPKTINGSTFANGNPISSDIDGTIISYSWTENGVELSTNAIFQYTPETVGKHRLTLKIFDNDGAFAMRSKIVNVTEVPNILPVADAGGDKTVEVNKSISIIGSGTDSDGTIASYNWTENGVSLATTVGFDYTPSTIGSHTLTLTVTDNRNGTATDTVIVEAVPPNVAPVANAGGNQSVEVNTVIVLSGANSSDTDGNIVKFEWSESGTVLHTSDHYEFNYTPSTEGDHSITLTVTDDDDAIAIDTITVIATPVVILSATCPATPTTDAGFTDMFVNSETVDTPWPSSLNNIPLTVDQISSVFNAARATTDPFGLQGKSLVMPIQAVWDGYSNSQKALFLINSERCARGILPYEGISPLVETTPAQYYADYLSSNNVFGHNEDGNSPWERLNTLAGVVINGASANADFFNRAENLAVNSLGSTGAYPTVHEPVAKAIYAWMYKDKEDTKVNINEPGAIPHYIYTYGHRKFILAKGLVENSGETNKEGLIGIGVSTVHDVQNGYNWTKTYTVMNAFDPNENWPMGNIQSVDLLPLDQCLDGYRSQGVLNPVGGFTVYCEKINMDGSIHINGEFYTTGRQGPSRYYHDVLLEVYAITPGNPNSIVDIIYAEELFNESFSIDLDLSGSLEATEILISVHSADTYGELGQFYYDLVDGKTVYDIGRLYFDELPLMLQ